MRRGAKNSSREPHINFCKPPEAAADRSRPISLYRSALGLLAMVAIGLASTGSRADCNGACPTSSLQCPIDSGLDIPAFYLEESALLDELLGPEGARLSARRFDVSETQRSVAEGQAVLLFEQRSLFAERIIYQHDSATAQADGPVILRDRELELQADSAFWSLNEGTADGRQLLYHLRPGPGRGEAESGRVYTGTPPRPSEFRQVSYTSCPPGINHWQLRARELELDHETGRGVARGAVLRAGKVPLFYLPWYSFPIDDRRVSGLLTPVLANTSDQGLDLTVPYYFNLAPNYDLTLAPRLISDRGVMIGSLFRYLQPSYRGEANIEYLPSDDERDRDRWFLDYRHNQRLASNWFGNVHLRRASDEAYFEDFSDNLNSAATTFLRSRAGVRGTGANWQFRAEADDFQTLDAALPALREPYRRLPRLTYDHYLNNVAAGINVDFSSEAVYFDRAEGLVGARLDGEAVINRPFLASGGFITPAIALRQTQYSLGNSGEIESRQSRTVPSYSLDSGLYFDRYAENGARMTLEPRLRYLYVPFRDQSRLPDFDTSEIDLSYSSLFRTNRFTGADRIGDANQLTVALGSRMFGGQDGRQMLSMGIGKLVYFDDREVNLDDGPPDTRSTSPLISEVTYRPSQRWSLTSNLVWDPRDDRIDSGLARVQYRYRDAIFNSSYRYRRDRVDQTDISFIAPIHERWSLFGRWNYAIDEKRSLESMAGFEYRSCCWALRLVHRKYLQNRIGDTRENIFLQFEFTGLGRVGGNVQSVLERGILGYQE